MTTTTETGKNVKMRQSNFELLRIFAMILIIANHFSVHSGFEFSAESITVPRLWLQFIETGGTIGVSIFVLITGYFSIHHSKLPWSKLIKLWLQLAFYSLTIYLMVLAFGIEKFSILELIKSVLPVSFNVWWFATTYFVLSILTPFMNQFLHGLSKKAYQSFLLTIFVMWCLVPTLTSRKLESNDLLWFLFLYAAAGYIRLWNEDSTRPGWLYPLAAIILSLLTFSTVIIFDIIGQSIPFVGEQATFFYGIQKLPVFLISLLFFLGFKNLKIGYHKYLNLIASTTFGIYLIHDSFWVRQILWHQIIKAVDYADTAMIIPYSVAVICGVFIVCGGIEYVRIHLLENNYRKALDRCAPYWRKHAESLSLQAHKLFSLL